MGNSESSQIQASILVFDSDKVQRDKIESILKIMLPKALVVQAQDEQNILARGKSKNWDVIVLSQKNNKMSGDFVIRKILEVKEIPPPKYFCLLLNSEDVPPQLPASVVTLKTPAGDEDLKVFFSKVRLPNVCMML
jgi:CheY-like chemotaxis protein